MSPDHTPPGVVHLLDDEAAVRDALAFLLGSRGMTVRAFATGPELLAAVDATPRPLTGVFLLDIRMEPMSGLAVHEALMARRLRNPCCSSRATATFRWRWRR